MLQKEKRIDMDVKAIYSSPTEEAGRIELDRLKNVAKNI